MMTITCLIGVCVRKSRRPLTSPASAATVGAEVVSMAELTVSVASPLPELQAAAGTATDEAKNHSDVRIRIGNDLLVGPASLLRIRDFFVSILRTTVSSTVYRYS